MSAQEHEPGASASALLASEARRYQLLLSRCMSALDQTHAALQQLSDLLASVAQREPISDEQLASAARLSDLIMQLLEQMLEVD